MVTLLLPTMMVLYAIQMAESFTLSKHIDRPICEPSQSCSYTYLSYTFELCDCPGMEPCSSELQTAINLKGITYQFCQLRELPTCLEGEIAAQVSGIQTSILCICPEKMMYSKKIEDERSDISYICKEKAKCQSKNSICGKGDHLNGIVTDCICPQGSLCSLPLPNFLSTQGTTYKATCTPI